MVSMAVIKQPLFRVLATASVTFFSAMIYFFVFLTSLKPQYRSRWLLWLGIFLKDSGPGYG